MIAAANSHQKAMETAETPAFADELATVWNAQWGAWDEVGPLRRVLVREPGDALSVVRPDMWDEASQALVDPDGHWYWTDRRPPDRARIATQHAGLVDILQREGVQVDVAPAMGPGYTKAVYMRDPLITTPHGAIIARMGVRMRRGEEPDVTRFVADLGIGKRSAASAR